MLFEVTHADGKVEYVNDDVLYDMSLRVAVAFRIVPLNGAGAVYYAKVQNVRYIYVPKIEHLRPEPPKGLSKKQVIQCIREMFKSEPTTYE